ncbi:signal peptide protein [Caballeronia hypogeia]|uniref:Signal peptide protein n=1 Tax=Caballeronia hypogeia TaxID=1777140 RepID=A0A157ZRP2_9BURK|nr:DUF2968 domain-containing protein [Caballeronia hypogeia]SAK48182.1 signal peptide protein [Caballeronia hypogeia]
MKSLLSRKGTLLDSAPSFLVRQNANNPVAFAVSDASSEAEAGSEDVSQETGIPSLTRPARGPVMRVTPLRPAAASLAHAGGQALQAAPIAEVEWLLQQGALTTFRTFQSFAYSVSLLFHPRELTYYAVLHHDDAVWRVLKAGDVDTAEPAFRHFIEQAMRLAEGEMRRAHLEAQNEQLLRAAAESEAQVERMRVDIQRGSSQDQEVAARQQEVRKELAQLEGRRVSVQVQLNKLQRQFHQLNAAFSENVPHLPSVR